MLRFRNALLCVGLLPMAAFASVPKQINHQGVVSVDGVAFDGTGLFRFAIVDPDAPINLWSNDGSITGAVGGIPTAAVTRQVVKGVYTVILGDINDPDMPNMTEEISSSLFNVNNARLRIWFDDGVNGIQMLSPDHKLTTAPYSARLPNVFVNDNGRVGIGITEPSNTLSVSGGADFAGNVGIGTTSPGYGDSRWLELNTANAPRPIIRLFRVGPPPLEFLIGMEDADNNLRIVRGDGVSLPRDLTSGIIIGDTGNVGIRTLPVNAILNVGNASFTSSILVNSNTRLRLKTGLIVWM